MTRHRKRWTAEENEKLRQMLADGVPRQQIAIAFNRTKTANNTHPLIYKRKPRGGPPIVGWSPEKIAQALRLSDEGFTQREIAASMETSQFTVYRYLKQEGRVQRIGGPRGGEKYEEARAERDAEGLKAFAASLALHHPHGAPSLVIPSRGIPFRARSFSA